VLLRKSDGKSLCGRIKRNLIIIVKKVLQETGCEDGRSRNTHNPRPSN